MFMYVFSIVLIVSSNIVYNICQKSTSQKVNPFAALLITYLTAALLSFIAFYFYKGDKRIFESFKELNWTSVALGFSILGLEFGYLMAYRAGWNISVAPIVANSFLTLMLIPIGILVYKEGFTLTKTIGVLFCIVGLVIINKK